MARAERAEGAERNPLEVRAGRCSSSRTADRRRSAERAAEVDDRPFQAALYRAGRMASEAALRTAALSGPISEPQKLVNQVLEEHDRRARNASPAAVIPPDLDDSFDTRSFTIAPWVHCLSSSIPRHAHMTMKGRTTNVCRVALKGIVKRGRRAPSTASNKIHSPSTRRRVQVLLKSPKRANGRRNGAPEYGLTMKSLEIWRGCPTRC